jgi:hypothetical protein
MATCRRVERRAGCRMRCARTRSLQFYLKKFSTSDPPPRHHRTADMHARKGGAEEGSVHVLGF